MTSATNNLPAAPDRADPPITLPLPVPCVAVMVGASGAGKSTLAAWLAAQREDAAVISYDRCREEIGEHMHDQAATPAAVTLALSRLDDRCASGLTTVVDGTHVKQRDRTSVLRMTGRHQMPAVAVVVATPLALCLRRQLDRPERTTRERLNRRVPVDVVTTQHGRLVTALPVLHTEGWTAVHIVSLSTPAHLIEPTTA